ncbi:MAG: hypothetical protein TH68_09065, partial [Candidatus Synechococcus spongiarum 142]
SLALSHAVGAVAEGGMDATPSRHHQFETKLAYGFPALNDRLTLTPGVGLALSPDIRTYSLLWALAPYAQSHPKRNHGNSPWRVSARRTTPQILWWSTPSSCTSRCRSEGCPGLLSSCRSRLAHSRTTWE